MTWRVDGYDVSHHNGAGFPWGWSRERGHRLAAWKVTQRHNFLDSTAGYNRTETEREGFPYRGLYHWQSPEFEASMERQLAWFVANVGDLHPGEFIQLDQEDSQNGVHTLDFGACADALELWGERYPGRVCHYGYGGYADKIHYRLPGWWWRASSTNTPAAENVVILQWGQTQVPGVGGVVDSNQIIDETVLRRLCGYGEGPVISYRDLEARSRLVLTAPYTFGASHTRMASPAEVIAQGTDCAQYAAWSYGPWMQVPDYTGDIYTWAKRTGRLIPIEKRMPGDLVLRAPGWHNIAIGHVGIVLADRNVIRQARSSHTVPNCGDWPISQGTWQTAVRMDVLMDTPFSERVTPPPTYIEVEEANVKAEDVHLHTDDQGNGWTTLVESGQPIPFSRMLSATIVTVPPDSFGFGYRAPGVQLADKGDAGGIVVVEGWLPKADVTVRVLVA